MVMKIIEMMIRIMMIISSHQRQVMSNVVRIQRIWVWAVVWPRIKEILTSKQDDDEDNDDNEKYVKVVMMMMWVQIKAGGGLPEQGKPSIVTGQILTRTRPHREIQKYKEKYRKIQEAPDMITGLALACIKPQQKYRNTKKDLKI